MSVQRRLPNTPATVATAGRGDDDNFVPPCASETERWKFDKVLDRHSGPANVAATEAARAVCGNCPIWHACLIDCLKNYRDAPGVVGGLTQKERRPKPTAPTARKSCGKQYGVEQHRRYNERPCDECLAAAPQRVQRDPAPVRRGRRETAECGTDSGYYRHRRLKDKTCDACRDAHSKEERERVARKKAA